MTIKEKINQLRKERHWTKSTLATKAGICANTVYNWYNEKNATPTRESIENVCSAFGISVAGFYADIDFDDLSAQEVEVLQAFRNIPDKKKDIALSMLKAMSE